MRLADMKILKFKRDGRPARFRLVRVLMFMAMTSMLGACSTIDAAGDKVVDYASTLNPLNWFDDDNVDVKRPEASDTAGAADSNRSDAKRKSRSSKVPSGLLYGDNRVNKYPKLGTIPDSPKAHKSIRRQLEREKLAQGLVADTKNAKYSEQVLKARMAVKPPPPAASPTTPVARSTRVTPPSAPVVQSPSAVRVPAPLVQAPLVRKAQSPRVTPPPAHRATNASGSSVIPRSQPIASRAPQAIVPAPSTVQPPPPPTAYQKSKPPQRFATPSGIPQVASVQPPQVRQNVMPPPAPPRYNAVPVAAVLPVQQVAYPPQVAALPVPAYGGHEVPGGQKALQVATIYFKNGSSRLGSRDRIVVQDVVSMYRETGGLIRIIGHSSGFAASQGSRWTKFVNFKVSLDRANAVASEFIRHGIPPDRIDVSAQGTESPRYAEYSPTGKAGNRRAEVFLEYANGS
tara:strand:+ start:61 stop:1434 length:1374 start_codon:yes stop_codon:yes gene_type:complete